MQLFHWRSRALADYSDGDIIVMANSVEEARDMVRKWYSDKEDYYSIYSYDALERDISDEPIIVEGGCIGIEGSS